MAFDHFSESFLIRSIEAVASEREPPTFLRSGLPYQFPEFIACAGALPAIGDCQNEGELKRCLTEMFRRKSLKE